MHILKYYLWKVTKLVFKCESFPIFNLSLWEFQPPEMSVYRKSKENLWTPVPLRGDVKAEEARFSPCSGHAVHPAYVLILIFKYRPKPSCKLTSYMSESAIQTLCGAQLFSWAHWHYQILLQTNSRSSRNALSAHITKALHWHLERKLSMLTIQIKHQQKNKWLQWIDQPDTSISLCSERRQTNSASVALAEWVLQLKC